MTICARLKKYMASKIRSQEQKLKELDSFKEIFPEPYYTFICNILANGLIDVERNSINDTRKEIEALKKKYKL